MLKVWSKNSPTRSYVRSTEKPGKSVGNLESKTEAPDSSQLRDGEIKMLVLNKVCLKKGHTHFEKVGTRILKSEHMYFEALKLAHPIHAPLWAHFERTFKTIVVLRSNEAWSC